MARYAPEQDRALINRNRTDMLNQPMLREGTDSDVMDFLDEVMTNPDVQRPPGFGSDEYINPQQYIERILAGDVVPMPMNPNTTPLTQQMLERRMQMPVFQSGSQGQQSLDRLPRPDMMDILQFRRP